MLEAPVTWEGNPDIKEVTGCPFNIPSLEEHPFSPVLWIWWPCGLHSLTCSLVVGVTHTCYPCPQGLGTRIVMWHERNQSEFSHDVSYAWDRELWGPCQLRAVPGQFSCHMERVSLRIRNIEEEEIELEDRDKLSKPLSQSPDISLNSTLREPVH